MSDNVVQLPKSDERNVRRGGREVERVFDILLEEIMGGTIPADAKLNGPALARRFGCSRGPIREALRRLEERRLVLCTPNAGARVISHTPREVIEAFEIREAMEGMAARLAARNMTAAELVALREAYENEKQAAQTEEGFAGEYRKCFHVQLMRGCHNQQLARHIDENHYSVFRLWRLTFPWLQWGGDDTWTDHRRILEAIELRDEDSAELLMRRHIRRLREQSIENLERIGQGHLALPPEARR